MVRRRSIKTRWVCALFFLVGTTAVNAAAVLVDDDGAVIGVIAGLTTESVATVVSEQGYVFNVDRTTGDVLPYSLGGLSTTNYYASNDCSGDPLDVFVRGNSYTISPDPDIKYAPMEPGDLSDQAYQSIQTGFLLCTPTAGTVEQFSLLVNDPLVTGIPNANVATPVTLETRTSCIFASSFEVCPVVADPP